MSAGRGAGGFVTALGCTVRWVPAPEHLDPDGGGVVLSLSMDQSGNRRQVEVYFSADDRRSLAPLAGDAAPGPFTTAERIMAAVMWCATHNATIRFARDGVHITAAGRRRSAATLLDAAAELWPDADLTEETR